MTNVEKVLKRKNDLLDRRPLSTYAPRWLIMLMDEMSKVQNMQRSAYVRKAVVLAHDQAVLDTIDSHIKLAQHIKIRCGSEENAQTLLGIMDISGAKWRDWEPALKNIQNDGYDIYRSGDKIWVEHKSAKKYHK